MATIHIQVYSLDLGERAQGGDAFEGTQQLEALLHFGVREGDAETPMTCAVRFPHGGPTDTLEFGRPTLASGDVYDGPWHLMNFSTAVEALLPSGLTKQKGAWYAWGGVTISFNHGQGRPSSFEVSAPGPSW